MSMVNNGILMYGVRRTSLKFKSLKELKKLPSVKEAMEDWDCEKIADEDWNYFWNDFWNEKLWGDSYQTVILPSGKSVCLNEEHNEDDAYIGIWAGFPWDIKMKDITADDVKAAIWQVLGPYLDMNELDVYTLCGEMSSSYCG